MQQSRGRSARPTAVFVLEQTLGHVTHSKNLQALVPQFDDVDPVFVPVAFDTGARRVPLWSNWTIRAGVRAARSLVRLRHGSSPVRADVLFVHTQVPAVLLRPWMERTPTVVSIDATPKQYDSLGAHYSHAPGPAWLERRKFEANRRCFEDAAHLVAWSSWARDGLVEEYGIPAAKISVIPPGVDVGQWKRRTKRAEPAEPNGPVRLLFVGGDLRRKGGDHLIAAFRTLRDDPDVPPAELHLVTASPVEPEPGLVVYHGLTSNSAELIRLYHDADIFCLPTLGDCLPMVLAEAAASELPLVSTDVGAIREIVRPGSTGELVPPGDDRALASALRGLILEPGRRVRYGLAAGDLARREHDAAANVGRLVDIMSATAR